MLGIEIGKDMERVNWEARIPGIQGKMQKWEQRDLSITGKILVVKAEVLSSLNFLAATLPVPKTCLATLRKIMFWFIWGSSQERLKRDVMYRPLEKGGKEVPDLSLKFNALFVTPIVNAVLNKKQVSLWYYFAKLWAGQRILNALGKRPPLNTPQAEEKPEMYMRALEIFISTKIKKAPKNMLGRATIEKELSPRQSSMVPVRSLIEEECIQVWKNVNSTYLLNPYKDLAWNIVHECLPTKSFQYRRHRLSRDDKCPRNNCGMEETTDHLFWACGVAIKVWKIAGPWLKEIYQAPSKEGILYGNMNGIENEGAKRWWAALNCIKEGIWRARNAYVFKRVWISPESIVKVSLSLIKDYVLLDKKKIWNRECGEMVEDKTYTS